MVNLDLMHVITHTYLMQKFPEFCSCALQKLAEEKAIDREDLAAWGATATADRSLNNPLLKKLIDDKQLGLRLPRARA